MSTPESGPDDGGKDEATYGDTSSPHAVGLCDEIGVDLEGDLAEFLVQDYQPLFVSGSQLEVLAVRLSGIPGLVVLDGVPVDTDAGLTIIYDVVHAKD